MTGYRIQQNKDEANHKVSSKYGIGGEGFPTKKAEERRAMAILKKTPVGDTVNGQDLHFLNSLFILHPNPDKRTGGIVLVRVLRIAVGPERGFEIVRADGSFTDISYRKCLRALTKFDCHKPSVIEAMRRQVVYQVWQFRLTQGRMAYDDSLVVDYQRPWTFDHLVKNFLKSEGATFEDIELAAEDRRMGADLPEPRRSKWADSHREHARLRMLPRGLNSKIGAREPPRP